MLIKQEDCHKCRGKGSVRHPEWVKFYEANPEYDRELDGYEDEVRFNDTVSKYFQSTKISRVSLASIPPQMIHCPDCGGRGETHSQVELSAALRAIGH